MNDDLALQGKSTRQAVLYIQDRIFLAVMHKRSQTEIDMLMAQLKRYTGA